MLIFFPEQVMLSTPKDEWESTYSALEEDFKLRVPGEYGNLAFVRELSYSVKDKYDPKLNLNTQLSNLEMHIVANDWKSLGLYGKDIVRTTAEGGINAFCHRTKISGLLSESIHIKGSEIKNKRLY